MCEIDDKPTKFLVDTGSNRTIVNKHFVNSMNSYGKIQPFYTNVLTAEGRRAHIVGIKRVKILIGHSWSILFDVLVVANLIKACILGMPLVFM